jgi:hypothetical protein
MNQNKLPVFKPVKNPINIENSNAINDTTLIKSSIE